MVPCGGSNTMHQLQQPLHRPSQRKPSPHCSSRAVLKAPTTLSDRTRECPSCLGSQSYRHATWCKTRMTEIFSDGADTVGTVLRTDKFSDVSIIQKIHEERASQNVSSFVFRPPFFSTRSHAAVLVAGCVGACLAFLVRLWAPTSTMDAREADVAEALAAKEQVRMLKWASHAWQRMWPVNAQPEPPCVYVYVCACCTRAISAFATRTMLYVPHRGCSVASVVRLSHLCHAAGCYGTLHQSPQACPTHTHRSCVPHQPGLVVVQAGAWCSGRVCVCVVVVGGVDGYLGVAGST